LREECIFLDTSTIIAREFGSLEEKKKLNSCLLNHRKSSTTYARTEINRTILKDAIFLHSLLIEEKDLSVVFNRLHSFPVKPRERERCYELFSKVTDKRQLRLADSVARLSNLIVGLDKLLLKDISLFQSGTGCPLATEEIEFVSPTYKINTSCTKTSPACMIEQYIETNKCYLRKVYDHIASNPNLKQLHDLLDKIFIDSKEAKGRNCQILADTIICLNSPIECVILATNAKDFEPICESLGKRFVGISCLSSLIRSQSPV